MPAPEKKDPRILTRNTDLEDIILYLNPYDAEKDSIEIIEDGVEYHDKPGPWNFKNVGHTVNRAIRIPYTFIWKNPTTKEKIKIRDYFLIGFEGGGAY
jgi:hypothetical protein